MIRPHEGVIAANCFEMHPLEEERVMEDGEEAEGEFMDASAFADGPLTKFVEGCSFEEAVKLHSLVNRAVETERRLMRPDDIVVSVVGHCLQAAANASNMNSLQFLQGLLESRNLPRSPPFAVRDDAEVWQERWPRWTFPVTGESAGPFTICVGFPVSAAAGEGALHSTVAALPPLNAASRLEALAQSCREKLDAADPFKGGVEAGVKRVRQEALAVAADCTGVVLVKAQQMHDRAENLYTLSEDNAKTVDEMLDFYAELVEASEGWIRVLVGPFAREDQLAHERLRERLPQVAVLCNFGENYEAPVKYEGCSYLADFRSASALLEQLERIGEKFLPPVVASVPGAAASVACTLESILAVPSVEYVLLVDGLFELGTQFHELLASVTVI